MTNREAFKTGFLARCVEQGLDREQTLALVKTAIDKAGGILGDVAYAGLGVLDRATEVAAPVAALGPPILGGLAGLGLARATDINDNDVQAVKDHELMNTYQTESARLRRERAARNYAKARRQSGRMFS
jgi:hypothetical protein